MGIGTALNISLTGLKTNQTQLDTTANNIANAGTAGYSRKRVSTQTLVAQETVLGVSASKIEREIDKQVQRQWRVGVANAEYAAVRSNTLTRLDGLFGGPSDANAVTNVFNTFKAKFERLTTSPEDSTARQEAAASAEALANRIRSLSEDVQTLRQDAETKIGAAVQEANARLEQIARIDKQILSVSAANGSTAALEDERDKAIDSLAELMDIRVEEQEFGAVAIYTTNGTLLYDDEPVKLRFDERGTLTPGSLYSSDPAKRGVGTVVIESGPGRGVDLFANDTFRSGAIAAYKELRDETLVRAQAQLDELAGQLSEALASTTTAGAAVPNGFSQSIATFNEGDRLTLRYMDGATEKTVVFVKSNGSFQGDDSYTADPNDKVVGIDGTMSDAAIAAAMQAALPAGFTVGYTAGGTAQITSTTNTVTGLSKTTIAKSFQETPPTTALPLFIDSASGGAFTGLKDGVPDKVGLAFRLAVNPAVRADASKLVQYQASTPTSDSTRPRAILNAVASATIAFVPGNGIGSPGAPFRGNVEQYLRQMVSVQGSEAESAKRISEGQKVVTANLEQRYNDGRKVSIDEELAQLIELQTAYQANARVMTAAREMLDVLMRM